MGLLTRQLVNAIRWATRALTGKTKTLRFEKLRALVTPECPFVNLPETRKARWGEALTAEKMKKCVWVRPEIVAQIEFLEWTDADHLRHLKFAGLRDGERLRSD